MNMLLVYSHSAVALGGRSMTFWGEPNDTNCCSWLCADLFFQNSLHRIWYLFCSPKTLWLMLAIGPTGWFAFLFAFFALLRFLRGLANQTSLQWWSSWGLVSQIWLFDCRSSTVMVCRDWSGCGGHTVTLAIRGSNGQWPHGVFDLCNGQFGISWTTQWNTSCLAPVRIMSHSHLKFRRAFKLAWRRIPPQRGPEGVSFEAFFNLQVKCEIIHTCLYGLDASSWSNTVQESSPSMSCEHKETKKTTESSTWLEDQQTLDWRSEDPFLSGLGS